MFDDSYTECVNISSLKIHVKIKYMNLTKYEIKEMNLIMNEKQFEVFSLLRRNFLKKSKKLVKIFKKVNYPKLKSVLVN